MKNHVLKNQNNHDKIGILLTQLGTPDQPTISAVRRYLRQILSDPRVIEINRFLWWFILNFIILRVRPKRSAALYKRIWSDEGSPLLLITKRQAKGVQTRLRQLQPDIEVTFGMRYGSPSIESALDQLIAKGCSKILLFPMYPQYAASTIASACDVAFPHLLKKRFIPALRVAEPYYSHPSYVDAITTTIEDFYASLEEKPERLLISYHGLPISYVAKGDPYEKMCAKSVQILKERLSIPDEEMIHTYQSRFGTEEWLTPYTDDTVEKLAKEGIKRIAIVTPGFSTDCLETLDELGNEAQELFEEHGGESIQLIPCLNDNAKWLDGMTEIIQEEISSWLKTSQRNIKE